jgi:hypothetical protein
MANDRSRRSVLVTAGALLCAGCSQFDSESEDGNQTATETADPTTAESTSADPTLSYTSGYHLAVTETTPDEPPTDPIVVAELPPVEEDAVRDAIETGLYCEEPPGSLGQRIAGRQDQNQYVEGRESYYGIFFAQGDQTVAMTGPARWCER